MQIRMMMSRTTTTRQEDRAMGADPPPTSSDALAFSTYSIAARVARSGKDRDIERRVRRQEAYKVDRVAA
jgi:hypothetical protein